MKRTKLRIAALALGGVLTLLAPVTAAARDRDDFHAGDRDHGRVEQNWNRNRDNDRRDWNRDRDGFRNERRIDTRRHDDSFRDRR